MVASQIPLGMPEFMALLLGSGYTTRYIYRDRGIPLGTLPEAVTDSSSSRRRGPIMKTHFAWKKVPNMRSTKVPARAINRVRRSQQEETQETTNRRLQTLGRTVVQEHLETFKRLADK